MLKNYLFIALRTIRKRLGYASINVFGLAVGLASCLLIGLYVLDELSYDRHHAKADRVTRVVMEVVGDRTLEVTPTIVGPLFKRQFPEVEEMVRLYDVSQGDSRVVRYQDRSFQEERFFYADSTVFDVFTLPFVYGTPDDALTRPNTIVLTQSAAQRYFGSQNPVGEALTVDGDRSFEVTGVIEDQPSTSHVQFDFLASFATTSWAEREIWMSANFYTYLLLQDEAAIASVQQKIPELLQQRLSEQASRFLHGLDLQPLPSIHLYANGNITYVYLFTAIALLILIIACVNFMNLATARSAERAKEVGVRKTLGAMRGGLISQFLVEAVLLALFAAVLALVMAEVALPAFRVLAGKTLTPSVIGNAGVVAAMFGLAVVAGLAAGSYPAFVLARFQPASVLKGSFGTSRQGTGLRKALVVFQFAVSVVLIASTAIVYQQLDYVQTTNLGFDKEQVVVLPINDGEAYPTLKQTLQQHPDVQHVSAVSAIPGGTPGGYTAQVRGMEADEYPSVAGIGADADVVEALGLDVLAGPGFPKSPSYDYETQGYVYLINESLARRIGWTYQEAIGKPLNLHGREGEVVGVVADFHQSSLHTEIRPLVFFIQPQIYDQLLVKVDSQDMRATLDRIERTWEQVTPGVPFTYRFLDDAYDALYRAELRTGRVFATFSVLAVIIACLGLFGLAAITAQQRTKEIGIRKVLGASVSGLVALLSKDFLKLVAVAFVLAVPVAYWMMHRWLQDFAYRIDLNVGVFVLAGGLALGVALLTVGVQAYRAATANPIDALRYE